MTTNPFISSPTDTEPLIERQQRKIKHITDRYKIMRRQTIALGLSIGANLILAFILGVIIIDPVYQSPMDETDARLKADHIDIQLDPVQHQSDIQKLKIYNISTKTQKVILFAVAGIYIVSLLSNCLTFLSLTGIINLNFTPTTPKLL